MSHTVDTISVLVNELNSMRHAAKRLNRVCEAIMADAACGPSESLGRIWVAVEDYQHELGRLADKSIIKH